MISSVDLVFLESLSRNTLFRLSLVVGVIIEALVYKVVFEQEIRPRPRRVVNAGVVPLLLGDSGAVGGLRLMRLNFHNLI